MPKPRQARYVFDADSGAALLCADEAARYLGYHPVSFRRLVSRRDVLAHARIGISSLFLREELDRFRHSSPWAARKAGGRPRPAYPSTPAARGRLKAVVTVGAHGARRPFRRLRAFEWEAIPSIGAAVGRAFGRVPFRIRVEAEDGSVYEVGFRPAAV